MTATAAQYGITEKKWPLKAFIIIKGTITFDKLPDFFSWSYGQIYNTLGQRGIQPTNKPCAFYYDIDETNKETRLAAAVPIPANVPDIPGMEKMILLPSRVISTTYYGPYENMTEAYTELEKYLDAHNLEKELMIEEYHSDPATEKDPAKWRTDIHFIVSSKASK